MMNQLMSAALFGLVFSLSFCSSEKAPNYSFVNEATTAPYASYYDYIIIGGGTAGCPLAATLSEKYKVLLLERGGSPYGNPNTTNLSQFGAALADLSPSSPSQRFISEDGVVNARARVLGGGSSINAGFYTRAETSFINKAGLDGRLVNDSYSWVEMKVVFKPNIREWQSAMRDGLVEVGIAPNNGFTHDHLVGTKVSGTIFDSQGQRHSAADLLEYANPSQLTVLLHASVYQIVFQTEGTLKPIANGVMFRDASGRNHIAYLNRGKMNEIIVSAGAIGSPQMLLLSGIGPVEQLKAHNITVVLDQPMVGQEMSDNPLNAILVPSPVPVEVSLVQVVGITPFGSYIEALTGKNYFGMPLQQMGLEHLIMTPKSMNEPTLKGAFMFEKIMGPLSTGHLELRTRNPSDNPSITFNYFQEADDLQRCVQGIKVLKSVIESKSFSKLRNDSFSFEALLNMSAEAQLNLLPRHKNVSESFEQFCKDTVLSIWHYHGGCHVGRVVDHDYKVLGVDALRVVDSSTFTDSPGTNPQATVMMLGRYMGVRILNDRFTTEK